MANLITTLGPKSLEEMELILPHEHIFVDLGPIEEENYRGFSDLSISNDRKRFIYVDFDKKLRHDTLWTS